MKMTKLVNGLVPSTNSHVVHEEEFRFNAPHTFEVRAPFGNDNTVTVQQIHFQEGPIGEVGVNGVTNEQLLGMVLCRLQHFNKSEFSCRENSVAATKIEEALMWLGKRTADREARGVEGTSNV